MPTSQTKEKFEDYEGFVNKFKPKKTTDDCYTPPDIYEAVKEWAVKENEWEGRPIVRPFYPGGDYENYNYPDNCVVIDNPPFSIITPIVNFFNEKGIDYFLFAPGLTLFTIRPKAYIVVGAPITYDNGAKVLTSFVSSKGPFIRTAPGLYQKLKEIQKRRKAEIQKAQITAPHTYRYPDNVVTGAKLQKLAVHGIEFTVEEAERIRALFTETGEKKDLFGRGYILNPEDTQKWIEAQKKAQIEGIPLYLEPPEKNNS